MGSNIRGSAVTITDLNAKPSSVTLGSCWVEIESGRMSYKVQVSDLGGSVSVPNATTSTRGLVLQAATLADISASGTTADAVAGSFNTLLARLRTAGVLAP